MAKKKMQYKRRANNEGSIYQRSNGVWCGAITTGYDETGRQKKKLVYGKSEQEVREKLSVYSTRVKSNTFEKLENKSASELMKEWLLVFKKNTVMPRTFASDIAIFTNHIEPHLQNLKVQDVGDMAIQQIINKMIDKDYSLSTIKKTKFLFNQFLDYAEQSKWILYNPAHKVKVRIKDKKSYSGQTRYKALPPEKRELFLQKLNKDPRNYLKTLCYLIMFSGTRIGEALGLQWKQVNLENKTITIEQAMTLLPIFNASGKVIKRKSILSSTKTACSVREVPLPDILVEELKYWKEKQRMRGFELHQNYLKPDSFVFCEDDNTIRTYSSCRLAFDRFKKAHGFKGDICFHGLRHTFSNILFESGENPKVIQQLLGHKDVSTTISVYNSVDKNYIKKSTEKFNKLFKPQSAEFQQNPTLETDTQLDDDIAELERLLEEKRKRRKEKDFEM